MAFYIAPMISVVASRILLFVVILNSLVMLKLNRTVSLNPNWRPMLLCVFAFLMPSLVIQSPISDNGKSGWQFNYILSDGK